MTEAPPLWKSCRLAYTICAFTAIMNLMFVKLNLNFALVYMTQEKNNQTDANTTQAMRSDGNFHWDNATKGHILSAFFYGYLLALLIGGWLSQNISAKLCFVVGNAGSAILNFFIPLSVYGGPWCLYAIRFFQGIFSGIMFPTIQLIFSSWTHVEERTKLLTFSFIGYNLGLVLVNPITSLFCLLDATMGWSYIFYVTGTFMLACVIAYIFHVFDSVHKHPRISSEEKEYILSGISLEDKKKAVPYRSIFTSVPVYAYFFVHTFQVFGYAALSTTLPFFLHSALKFDVIENGFISALPYVFSTISRFLIGLAFNPMLRLTKLSLTRFRKVNHVIGTVIPAIFFVLVTLLADDHKIAIIVLICLVECFCDLGYSGSYAPSFIDLAPNYTGFLSGIATAVANLPFVAVAKIFGYLIDKGTTDEWKILWYICSATYIIGCIVYVLFGTSVRQHWG